MTEERRGMAEGNRIYFLDNLRTFMIFLVVLFHAGLVYESSGITSFFWIVDDHSTSKLAGILAVILEPFVMPAIFLISGFFAPLSLKSRGAGAFLVTRVRRLVIPWIVAVFTLMPLYKFLFLYSRKLPQQGWTTYFHFSNGIFSQSWLWFLPVLFIFNLLYLLLSRVKIDISRITLKAAVPVVLLAGFAYNASFDFFGGAGWTKTMLLDFQNERVLVYFLYFLLGALCFRLKTFESAGRGRKLFYSVAATAWIPVTSYTMLFIYPLFMKPGAYLVSRTFHTMLLRFTAHLSMLFMVYLMISIFRYYLNRQGMFLKELSRNSYGVYITHTIVLGAIATLLLGAGMPSLLKYLVLTVSTWVVCNLLASGYRKVVRTALPGRFPDFPRKD